MQWTALDLKNLAALFDDMADALWNFRIKNGSTLTQSQKNQFTAEYGQLVSYGERFENKALQSALHDIDAAVVDLQNAAHDATHALEVISDVQKAITIAVAAVGLGAAIMNPTPGTIANSVNTLVQAVKQANTKPADAGGNSGTPPKN